MRDSLPTDVLDGREYLKCSYSQSRPRNSRIINNAICVAGGSNTCAAGDSSQCPLPLSNSYYYCQYNKMNPRVCEERHQGNTCFWHTNDTCGNEYYCLSRSAVLDSMGHYITCDGLQDWCVTT
jgi:hypothetical protein